jgi:hypothetical protein
MKKAFFLALTATVGLSLTACGEYSQIPNYKQGSYQGKSDTRPWEGEKFAGNKQAWENDLRARNQGQTEYNRIK